MRFLLGMFGFVLLAGCGGQNAANQPAPPRRPEMIKSADKIPLAGFLYPAAKPKAIILLFHQAGSSKYEYDTIAPRLAALGYTAYTIDQRAGGLLYGDNSTIALLSGSRPLIEAMPDLQAAVDWARPQGLPVILWGSSYSASLSFIVAANNPTVVKAVMAFSPGEYFDDKGMVTKAASRLRVPVFVTSAKDAGEIAAARQIIDAVPSQPKVQYVPQTAGTHGSSTLIDAKDPKGAAENWRAVEAFLKQVAP